MQPYIAHLFLWELGEVTIKGKADVLVVRAGDDGRPDHNSDEDLLRVTLHSGSLSWGKVTRDEEGWSSTTFEVETGEDSEGQPCWLVSHTSAGRDCDGLIENHSRALSYGGIQPGGWLSPDTHIKSWVYDEYARAAGY